MVTHLLQYCCLEDPTDRGAWWATVHRATASQTRLSDLACMCVYVCVCIKWKNAVETEDTGFLSKGTKGWKGKLMFTVHLCVFSF